MAVLECDVCIVGCGAAGAILASRLASTPGRRVIVLERGPEITPEGRASLLRGMQEQGRALDWANASSEPTSIPTRAIGEPPWSAPMVSAVGGSSLGWTGHADRPRADDLRVASSFGFGRDWPFGWEQLEPWLTRAERALGVAAQDDNPYASARSAAFPMPAHPPSWFDRRVFAPACERLGWRAHSHPVAIQSVETDEVPACSACRRCDLCPSGARYSADRRHVPELKQSATGHLLERAQVRRLERDGARVVTAHAVAVRSGGTFEVHAQTFVLAAGAIETPRLLLLSELGGAQVGRGFSDQALVPFDGALPEATGTSLGFPTLGCDHLRQHVDRRAQNGAGLLMRTGPSRSDTLLAAVQADGHFLPTAMRRALLGSIQGHLRMELEARGTIALHPDAVDELGDRLASVELSLSERDHASLGALRGEATRLAEAMGASTFAFQLPASVSWGGSPFGGCAMARSADEGVCDADLRVFGLENLYALSSASIPHLGAAPAPLTLAALALRLANHLEGAP